MNREFPQKRFGRMRLKAVSCFLCGLFQAGAMRLFPHSGFEKSGHYIIREI